MGALTGCRVLDISDEKGMFCSKLLAGMGAEVILIGKPDDHSHLEQSEYCYLNTGKRAVTLDIEKPEGQALFKRLADTSQVIIETFSPGYLSSLGLAYQELSESNPGLIMASITDFGQSGPYRHYKSGDLVSAALGGWMSVTGEKAMPPLKPYGNQSYYTASLFAANGIMLALWHLRAGGKGQHIDVSIMESVAATLDHVLVRHFAEGEVAQRNGRLLWNNSFRIFPCRDGYILLTIFHQWATLVEWLVSECMAGDLADPGYLDEELRLKEIDHIIGILERWTRTHTVADLVETGQLMRFPWAEVDSLDDLLQNPQLLDRHYFATVESGEDEFTVPGAPVRMSRSPWITGGRVPAAGENNEDIYRQELGLTQEEMLRLKGKGVI
jgi:crotonobetainyl-CoA:carnitine CoA-transferase CaiB-like acyl-CoA transferase